MTNGWTDVENTDVVLVMGGNPAGRQSMSRRELQRIVSALATPAGREVGSVGHRAATGSWPT